MTLEQQNTLCGLFWEHSIPEGAGLALRSKRASEETAGECIRLILEGQARAAFNLLLNTENVTTRL